MSNVPQKEIVQLPKEILAEIRKAIIEKGKVKITGLGIFETRQVKARRGRNPRTGAEIKIPAYTKIKFKPTASLKEGLYAKD